MFLLFKVPRKLEYFSFVCVVLGQHSITFKILFYIIYINTKTAKPRQELTLLWHTCNSDLLKLLLK